MSELKPNHQIDTGIGVGLFGVGKDLGVIGITVIEFEGGFFAHSYLYGGVRHGEGIF